MRLCLYTREIRANHDSGGCPVGACPFHIPFSEREVYHAPGSENTPFPEPW
jgi:hypothetical protein